MEVMRDRMFFEGGISNVLTKRIKDDCWVFALSKCINGNDIIEIRNPERGGGFLRKGVHI